MAMTESAQKNEIDTSVNVKTFHSPCISPYGDLERMVVHRESENLVLRISDYGKDFELMIPIDKESVKRLHQFTATCFRELCKMSLDGVNDSEYNHLMEDARENGVVIEHNNELGVTNPRFSVSPISSVDYWLGSFVLEDDAYAFCNNNGLAVHRQECTIEKCKYCELAKKERSHGEQTR